MRVSLCILSTSLFVRNATKHSRGDPLSTLRAKLDACLLIATCAKVGARLARLLPSGSILFLLKLLLFTDLALVFLVLGLLTVLRSTGSYSV